MSFYSVSLGWEGKRGRRRFRKKYFRKERRGKRASCPLFSFVKRRKRRETGAGSGGQKGKENLHLLYPIGIGRKKKGGIRERRKGKKKGRKGRIAKLLFSAVGKGKKKGGKPAQRGRTRPRRGKGGERAGSICF